MTPLLPFRPGICTAASSQFLYHFHQLERVETLLPRVIHPPSICHLPALEDPHCKVASPTTRSATQITHRFSPDFLVFVIFILSAIFCPLPVLIESREPLRIATSCSVFEQTSLVEVIITTDASSPSVTMESPPVVPETSKSPDGLTALHLAVIHNDHPRVRELLSSGEYGVDARSAKGTTPLMLTCLFGRYNIFLALIRKKASLKKQDTNGLGVMEYIRQLSLTHDMLKRYQAFTGQQPSIKGRQSVFSILRLCIHARNQKQHDSQVLHGSHNHRDEEAEIRPEANVRSAAPATVPADSDTIFLRDGKELKIVEVRTLARAEFNIDVGRKSSGGIRAKGEQHFMKMAISGWGGVSTYPLQIMGLLLIDSTGPRPRRAQQRDLFGSGPPGVSCV